MVGSKREEPVISANAKFLNEKSAPLFAILRIDKANGLGNPKALVWYVYLTLYGDQHADVF